MLTIDAHTPQPNSQPPSCCVKAKLGVRDAGRRAVMAHYRASESKREQFRRYLEKAGVLDSLTSVLVALYEENEKPNNALDFLRQHLGVVRPEPADMEALRLELAELNQKYELLLEENKELKNRLLQYEPAQEEGAAE